MKKNISLFLAAAIMFSTTAFAKSDNLIDYNLDKMKEIIYREDFGVYTEAPPEKSVYYGAKFEPRSGVIIGTPENCAFPGIKNGIDTVYDWFVPSDEIKNENVPREEIPEKPSDHMRLIGWNWNFASQKYVDMSQYENYIKNYIDRLSARGQDILLVFGKEMNIDDNFLDEQVFIDCYRYVAEYAKTKENIAMVWAPNDTGGLDTRLIDFYPGNDYVDWIGCSLYTMPYFTGDKNASYGSNIGFIMGPYANPVARARVIHDFMEENGIYKPVFITEGGIGYASPDGEDFTDWSLQQLRKYYGEMIRMYPEFKCIVSFNNYVPDGDYYRYDMGNNAAILENLQYMTQNPIFIKDYPNSAKISYTPIFDGIDFTDSVKLSAVGYMAATQWMRVDYVIDGETLHSSMYPPYTFKTSGLDEGEHHLTVNFYVNDDCVNSLDYDFGFKKSPPPPAPPKRVYKDEEYRGGCEFSDMAEAPAEMKNAVAALVSKSAVNGVGGNNFDPDSKLTRAAAAKIVANALNLPKGDADFNDVTPDAWYYDSVAKAAAAGIINGFEDGSFRPNEPLTNAQLTAMLAKYKGGNAEAMAEPTFSDKISPWVWDFVKTAVHNGFVLVYDDNSFGESRTVSRGEGVVIINRFLNQK